MPIVSRDELGNTMEWVSSVFLDNEAYICLKTGAIHWISGTATNRKPKRWWNGVKRKASLAYRSFVREAVRRCVLEWKAFQPEEVMAMTAQADIPDADRQQVVDYVGLQFHGLHEGNAIRYRLGAEDLIAIRRQ